MPGLQLILPFAQVPAIAELQRACDLGKVCDLAKQLPDQADKHKMELHKLKDAEEALQAEF